MARRPGWTPGIVRARRIEGQYNRQLRKVARQVGLLMDAFDLSDIRIWPALEAALARYSALIGPWANATAGVMLAEVDRKDLQAWRDYSQDMKRSLIEEIQNAPTGQVMRGLLADQVRLIKSIPLAAGQRVHDWTLEGIANGTRAAEVAAAILDNNDVTLARATLIARTEVARTASVLCQSRAQSIGSNEYVWRTSGDSDVRPGHRAQNGKVINWAAPPLCDPPRYRAHAGQIFNCRCYPEPIIPDL